MTRYCDQNSTKDSIDSRLKNIESLKEDIFQIEEKNNTINEKDENPKIDKSNVEMASTFGI